MVVYNNILAGAAGSGGAAGYKIERSLRFNDADTAFLSRTPSSASSGNTKLTYSVWIKGADIADKTPILSTSSSGGSESIEHRNDGTLVVFFDEYVDGAYTTSAVFRDPSAWYHYVFSIDTTLATAADRVKIYVNGAEVSTTASPALTQNFTFTGFNQQNKVQYIGRTANTSGGVHHYASAMYADIHMIDGQALAPTDFGAPDDNNVWQPKAYSGTYGTNGFHLDFSDNSSNAALGTDAAGSNDWTVNNLTASGTKWSSYLIPQSPATFDSSYPASEAFDGSIAANQEARLNSGSYADRYIDFIPTGGIAFSNQIEMYVGATNFEYSYNGGSNVAVTAGAWHTVASGGGTLTSIRIQRTQTLTHTWRALRVDGTILVDGDPAGTDSLIDTPTNYEADSGNNGGNYCTMNPLAKGPNCTLSNGNLDITTQADPAKCLSTIGMSSGKWYSEFTCTNNSPNPGLGTLQTNLNSGFLGNDAYGWVYGANGKKYHNDPGATGATYGASYTTGDVIGVAFDADAGTLTFYKNGTSQGAAYTGLTSGPYFFATGGSYSSSVANFGQRPFAYTPPTGYVSLCTTNLPDPTIADGSTAFDVDAYTGNGSTQERSEFSFEPDLVWIKARSAGYNHYLVDQVRGFNGSNARVLQPNLTNAEESADGPGDAFASFDDDGFTVKLGTGNWSGTNQNNATYVAWAWDAGANSSKTYTVKVVSDGGNKFRFDDFGTSAVTLDLEEGSTYVFDQSDSSNATHPLRFATAADAAGGTEYTTGVTTTGTPGQTGAKTTITVASGAPTLYYYCSSHTGMGGQANTNSTAGASSFAGSIQSTVRANASAGFSIVSYVGTQAINTIGHGLNATPQMFIVKSRDTAFSGDWRTYHLGIGDASKYLKLHSTAAATTGTSTWNSTEPNSSVFTLGTGSTINKSGDNYIAYCFAPVEGYSAFGSYTGNGSSDGPFVFTNFRPALVICKPTTTTGSWQINDSARNTFNVADEQLFANESIAATTTTNRYIDFLSNGFKVRGDNASFNGSGHTYVYLAFSENPFKTARAR